MRQFKNLLLFLLILTVYNSHTYAAVQTDPVEYVNPLIGTMSKHSLSNGNTYPAIAVPWGMHFWMPQTGKSGDGWSYTYDAEKIRGFKQTHQPSPWINDYAQFAIMPLTNKPVFNEEERASWFSHKTEIVKPYYYKVYLADHNITTELTPTSRAVMFRFTFPESDSSFIAIDAMDGGSYVKIIPKENKIIGYTTKSSNKERVLPEGFKNYFVITFDKPFSYTAVVQENNIDKNRKEVSNNHTGAIIGFQTQRNETIHARIASSFISFEQAELNLQELGSDTFEQIMEKGKNEWNKVLGCISIEDDNIDNLRTFYSCLYRSVLFPRSFYEINADKKIIHRSPYNGKVQAGYMFTDTGFWDTFRSLFPLLNLVYPEINVKIQKGLVNAYKESGFLPEWSSPGHFNSMIGNNSASVVANAYLSGLRGYDIEKLWEAVVHGSNAVHPQFKSVGRIGYKYYNKLGYIPYNVGINENAARTLEYAYSDWSIYKLGQALHKPEEEINIYAKRAMNYKKLFDPTHKLMRARNLDGSFQSPFNPFKWGDAFTEGNSWHYTWSVFHDPQGLIDLMGGEYTFNQMMDSVFTMEPIFDDSYYGSVIHEIREMQIMNMGQYAHGNQPIQHMIYLYNYSKQPWKAQYWVREVMEKLYHPTPDGYCGDEDNGQTSAWYVFSALGFYPVCPGSNQYILGSPLFKKATIHLQNGKKIIFHSTDNSPKHRYINEIIFNGKKYTKNYLDHQEILSGAKIEFNMSATPNITRGTEEKDIPYSFSKELKIIDSMNGQGIIQTTQQLPNWALGPFIRPKKKNPIISPDETSSFYCPIQKREMKWEEKDTFNPAAAIKKNKICILYRAEDNTGVGIGQRTSRIGYAESTDGIHMAKRAKPVLYPAKDIAEDFDSPGGCEDPRVAVTEDGLYVMFYTGNNKKNARLCVATSKDLIHWEKHGLAFGKAYNGRFKDTWSKSAAIVTRIKDGKQVITKINGKYLIYWGEFETAAATSNDLINWEPVLDENNELKIIAKARKGRFDSMLVECGPPALLTDNGILLLYNGKNSKDPKEGDNNYPLGAYAAGQLLLDKTDPCKVIGRLDTPFFYPTESFEKSGQYADGTVFVEGLAYFKKKWFLYYGCADSKVGVAIYNPLSPKTDSINH